MISSRRFFFPCFLFALFIINIRASAQNETGVRNTDSTDYYWFDSTRSVFQTSYPIIRNIPPLSTGMPWEVLVSYIAADSLLRTMTEEEIINRINAWTSINDTSKVMTKFLYTTTDFNPVILAQYKEETAYYKIVNRYKSSFLAVQAALNRHLLKFLPDTLKRTFMSEVLADYVLRVKVIRVDSTFNLLSHKWNRYRAIVEVLDTIKGKVFKQFIPDWNLSPNVQTVNHTYSYMSINFSPWVYEPTWRTHFSEIDGLKGDEEFKGNKNYFLMKPGQEAVIFASHSGRYLDTSNDYFLIDIIREYSNGALPIIDGKVRDINHVWSDQTLMDYDEWKLKYEAIRNKILNQTY